MGSKYLARLGFTGVQKQSTQEELKADYMNTLVELVRSNCSLNEFERFYNDITVTLNLDAPSSSGWNVLHAAC